VNPFRYVSSGESSAKTVALGAAASSLGVLVLPAAVVTGYYGRVLVRSSRGDTAPEFEDVGGLLVDGLRAWLAIAVYLTAGFALAVGFGIAALALGSVNTGLGAGVGAFALALFALLVVGVVAFPAWYFVPAAMTRLAREESVGAAFELGAIRRVIFDRRYFRRWLAGCGLLVAGTALYYGFAAGLDVPVVGHVLGAAVNFYCQTAAFYCFGRGYAAATDGEPAETDDADSVRKRPQGRSDASATDTPASDETPSAETDAEARTRDEWGADAERWREERDANRRE